MYYASDIGSITRKSSRIGHLILCALGVVGWGLFLAFLIGYFDWSLIVLGN